MCLLIGAVLAVRYLGPQTVGETVRRKICAQLRSHYPSLNVSIGRGNFDPHRGMVLEDITFAVPGGMLGRSGPVIAHIDELVAAGSINTEGIGEGQSPFTTERIRVSGLDLNIWPTLGDSFSIAALLPLPVFGPVTPRTDLHDVRIRLFRDSPSKTSRPIECVCQSATLLQSESSDGPVRKLIASGTSQLADVWSVHADLSGRKNETIDLRAKLQSLTIDPNLFRRLPPAMAAKLSDIAGLRCVADVEASVLRTAEAPTLNYFVKTNVRSGGFTHPKLPLPLDSLSGQMEWSPNRLMIRHASAGIVGSMIRMTGRIDSPLTDPDADIRLNVSDFRVDRALVTRLPDSLQEAWDRVRIEGTMDGNVHIQHRLLQPSGTPIDVTGQVVCKGVEANFHRFPPPGDADRRPRDDREWTHAERIAAGTIRRTDDGLWF